MRRERGLHFIDIGSVDADPMCGWGLNMVEQHMERLVLDVVRSVIGDEVEDLTLDSDLAVLGVDQLTVTYIVLALENRLGIELPTYLEDARTVAGLEPGRETRCGPALWQGGASCRRNWHPFLLGAQSQAT